jgi:hypothetical protein
LAIAATKLFVSVLGTAQFDLRPGMMCFNSVAWLETLGGLAMATQIVMNHTGDSRHYFDARDGQALAKAEERFNKLTGAGFTAAVRTAAGEVSRIRSFDPTAEETLFFPRLVGG